MVTLRCNFWSSTNQQLSTYCVRRNEFSDHDGDTTFSLERSQDIDFSLFIPCLLCCVRSIFGLHTIFSKRGKHSLHKSHSFNGKFRNIDCGIQYVDYGLGIKHEFTWVGFSTLLIHCRVNFVLLIERQTDRSIGYA